MEVPVDEVIFLLMRPFEQPEHGNPAHRPPSHKMCVRRFRHGSVAVVVNLTIRSNNLENVSPMVSTFCSNDLPLNCNVVWLRLVQQK